MQRKKYKPKQGGKEVDNTTHCIKINKNIGMRNSVI